jgi:DNA-binding NarL/FixJ family response regulator
VKSLTGADLANSLRGVLDKREFHVARDEATDPTADNAAGLTDREVWMLKTLARGLSNKAIGKELWIAEQTVKFHLTNIYRKLGVGNRTQAIRYAYEHGLVQST